MVVDPLGNPLLRASDFIEVTQDQLGHGIGRITNAQQRFPKRLSLPNIGGIVHRSQ